MIKKLITIGIDSKCDFVISKNTMPTLKYDIIEQIKPVHAQILQDDDEYLLNPFSDYIYINGCGITSDFCKYNPQKITNGLIKLDIEDRLSLGIDVLWQQWMVGLGLSCDKCKYRKYSMQDDNWCKYCKECHYNPAPYIYGYSPDFDYLTHYSSGFYNYANCNECNLKPNYCIECDLFLKIEPKNRSFKDHVDMYIQRINNYKYNDISK